MFIDLLPGLAYVQPPPGGLAQGDPTAKEQAQQRESRNWEGQEGIGRLAWSQRGYRTVGWRQAVDEVGGTN